MTGLKDDITIFCARLHACSIAEGAGGSAARYLLFDGKYCEMMNFRGYW